jgi:hypothetical protein
VYATELRAALRAEQDPVAASLLTPWRTPKYMQKISKAQQKRRGSLVHIVQKQLNLDIKQALRALIGLWTFGVLGASSAWGRRLLCIWAPVLLLLGHVRAVRWATKLLFNLLPPVDGPTLSLFRPLLPVAVQTINSNSLVWRHADAHEKRVENEKAENEEVDEDESLDEGSDEEEE